MCDQSRWRALQKNVWAITLMNVTLSMFNPTSCIVSAFSFTRSSIIHQYPNFWRGLKRCSLPKQPVPWNILMTGSVAEEGMNRSTITNDIQKQSDVSDLSKPPSSDKSIGAVLNIDMNDTLNTEEQLKNVLEAELAVVGGKLLNLEKSLNTLGF